ncbi:hypothetical protein L9F63_025940, partial [Diploptera punctata]
FGMILHLLKMIFVHMSVHSFYVPPKHTFLLAGIPASLGAESKGSIIHLQICSFPALKELNVKFYWIVIHLSRLTETLCNIRNFKDDFVSLSAIDVHAERVCLLPSSNEESIVFLAYTP